MTEHMYGFSEQRGAKQISWAARHVGRSERGNSESIIKHAVVLDRIGQSVLDHLSYYTSQIFSSKPTQLGKIQIQDVNKPQTQGHPDLFGKCCSYQMHLTTSFYLSCCLKLIIFMLPKIKSHVHPLHLRRLRPLCATYDLFLTDFR